MEQKEILNKVVADAKAELKDLLVKELAVDGAIALELEVLATKLGAMGPVVIAAIKPLLLPMLQGFVAKI